MIIRLVLLIVSTVCALLFLVALIKGKEMHVMVENLEDSGYFLKNLYIAGFALNEMKLFRLRGKLGRDLKKNSKLLYDNIYFEYYAHVAWAQFLTLSLLTAAIGFSLCSMIPGDGIYIMPLIVVLFLAAIWNLSLSKMKEEVAKRKDACDAEFSNMVSKLSLLLSSGMVLRDAWYYVANGKEGPLYDLMKHSCDEMDNGESEKEAIRKFGVLTDSMEIRKFTSALIQSTEKGNSELVGFMRAQVTEQWAHKRQVALQQGEIAAGKLVIPLGLMFAGIILIIVAAAMQSMTF